MIKYQSFYNTDLIREKKKGEGKMWWYMSEYMW